jgi:hypothetical protein
VAGVFCFLAAAGLKLIGVLRRHTR